MAIKHSKTANPNDIVASADWNANHVVDGTTGEVLFLTAGGDVGADANLFWDNTNKRLGVGTNTPSVTLEINGEILADNFSTSNIYTYAGKDAGLNATGSSLVCVGYYAGEDSAAEHIVVIGDGSGYMSTGNYCTFVGYSSGTLNIGRDVVGIGYEVAIQNEGDYSIGIGSQALTSNTGNDVVAIGDQAGLNNATANQFILKQTRINAVPLMQGDFSTGNVAIGKTTAGSKLGVAGLPIHADNAAAIIGGLAAGDFYRTGADPDPLMVVH